MDDQVGQLEVPVDSRNTSDGAIADVPVGSRGRDPCAHRVPPHCGACTVTQVQEHPIPSQTSPSLQADVWMQTPRKSKKEEGEGRAAGW